MANSYYMDNETGRARVVEIINGLLIEKKWTVEIKRHVKRRSNSQNSLMWKWIGDVVKHVRDITGMDKDEIHEFFKNKFITPEIRDVFGETVEYRSTKKMSVPDMCEYMKDIDRWCIQELGLALPIPEEMQLRG